LLVVEEIYMLVERMWCLRREEDLDLGHWIG
jgi:hypothetical protein